MKCVLDCGLDSRVLGVVLVKIAAEGVSSINSHWIQIERTENDPGEGAAAGHHSRVSGGGTIGGLIGVRRTDGSEHQKGKENNHGWRSSPRTHLALGSC